MLFNSVHYLFFLPTVVLFFWLLPRRHRWTLLLGASYYFYMCWKAEYAFLIAGSTLLDYFAGIRMGRCSSQKGRKRFLLLSLSVNLGLLFAFKYFNFFNESTRSILDRLNIFYDIPAFDALLPVGISFYTFQTLSYSIDVYRGEREPERHLGIFALYVAYFPQLVAGPIERSSHLLPQLQNTSEFSLSKFQQGIQLILWGLFKKLVIADRLAVYVDAVYNDPTIHVGAPVVIATYFFAFQIYCDFSGYSDIAIGSSMLLGHELMENFKRPYFARSISEFWKRWHVSLSTWFRDYLYISIGGNRVAKWRWLSNVLFVFLVSGLWHGANWTFVVWGALHGTFLVCSILVSNAQIFPKLNTRITLAPWATSLLRILATFHLVALGWVFFRAESLSDALEILRRMQFWRGWTPNRIVVGLREYEMLIALLSIGLLLAFDFLQRKSSSKLILDGRPVWLRWLAFYSLLFGILVFGRFTSEEFIYFQF